MIGRTKVPLACGMWMQERGFLEGLTAMLPEGARIVNIGAAAGTSTVAILRGARDIRDFHVWSIDIMACPGETGYVRDCGLSNPRRYTQVVGDSGEVGMAWNIPLDLVFVDGCHNQEGVGRDIKAWAPHVKAMGLLVFHDYDHVWPGVTNTVDEWFEEAVKRGWRKIGRVSITVAFLHGEPNYHLAKIPDSGFNHWSRGLPR